MEVIYDHWILTTIWLILILGAATQTGNSKN